MKRHLFTITFLSACLLTTSAQKKALDHSVYDAWQLVGPTAISPKGNILSYEVNPQEGDGYLVVRNIKQNREITIPRGYRAQILDNEQQVVCLIKPFFKDTRQAKIKKKKAEDMPKDTLAIINTKDFSVKKFASVQSYQLGKHAVDAVAFLSTDTALIPKKERTNKDIGKPLLVYSFATGAMDTLKHIGSYHFDKQGKALTVTVKEKKKKMLTGWYDVAQRTLRLLTDTMVYYSLPQFDETGSRALFIQAADTLDSGSKHGELMCMSMAGNQLKSSKLVALDQLKNLPEGWGITENSRPSFSRDGKRIFVGVQPYQAPKDTTLVPFETAGLDIWNYNAPEIPPMMKANLQRDLSRTMTAVYDEQQHQLIPLSTSPYDRVTLMERGNAPYALSIDRTKTIVATQWDMQGEQTISLVNLSNGKRTPVVTGKVDAASASPAGKYVVWYDAPERCWMVYDINAGSTKTLSANIPTCMWDEEDDHPMMPQAYGIAGWTQNDQEVLIYDRYDIWKVNPANGHTVCLTKGQGREKHLTYRYIPLKDAEEEPFIRPNESLYLSVFDNVTKKNGYASVAVNKPAAPQLLALEGYMYANPVKAKDANVYLYKKGNFQHPMDLYVSTAIGKKEQQLSHINPQQKDYLWGTAELFHWYAYDGTPLDGLLYKPENFDENKKYPVMIYFYEKRSENLYQYYSPAPSRSTVNIPFYCSRGYLVFVPDIVYHAGTPGESAYNCIVSGAEALAKNKWVDKENMAIQGQSWGGYQVAYLITRTNMFKAAGAGAPVANMTSAYGGIRWQSGMSRQFQYEQSQSRIGRDLWSGIELYMENSPLFKLPNVQTPVLIMHNDADGAVPWYQGIEMFMGLRRLGKPAWLLEYNNEEHNLKERRNSKDLSIRLQQFFDHYLKGAPEPAWMKYGIPTSKKGQYFGFENAE